MQQNPNSLRHPIAVVRERAFDFAALTWEWDEAAWNEAWTTVLRSRRHVHSPGQPLEAFYEENVALTATHDLPMNLTKRHGRHG